MRRSIPILTALVWIAACGGEPPAQEPAQQEGPGRADSVQMAMASFDSTVFDTIAWRTEQEALERGSLVFRVSCAKCHGQGARGNGGFVHRGDTLRPPSFLAAGWRYAEDPMGLRRAIYSGSVLNMPYWGLLGLKYSDLDAVSRYILDYLVAEYGEQATGETP